MTESVCCDQRLAEGTIRHLGEPEYHGSPRRKRLACDLRLGVRPARQDRKWTPFDVEVRRFNDRGYGIVAEPTEVIICRKQDQAEAMPLITIKGP